MRSRLARIENLSGLKRKCPDCGNEMTATGDIEYNENLDRWFISFWCPSDEWIVPVWSADLAPLIEGLTKDIDPSTLPSREM